MSGDSGNDKPAPDEAYACDIIQKLIDAFHEQAAIESKDQRTIELAIAHIARRTLSIAMSLEEARRASNAARDHAARARDKNLLPLERALAGVKARALAQGARAAARRVDRMADHINGSYTAITEAADRLPAPQRPTAIKEAIDNAQNSYKAARDSERRANDFAKAASNEVRATIQDVTAERKQEAAAQ